MPRPLRRSVALTLLAALATACGTTSTAPAPETGATGGVDPTTFAAQVPSGDLYIGAPQRISIGIFRSTDQAGVELVTSGTVDVTLAPFEGGAGTAVSGSARYVPAPGTNGDASGTPLLTAPDVARGVYQLEDVTFDAAGIWQADVRFSIQGQTLTLSTQFPVNERPALPAPGDRALATENLTADSKGVDLSSVDSRAMDGAPLPDPELHQDTIAGALKAHRPILVLFATPVYCQSQFCVPTTGALQSLAANGPPDAAYIHVEIWHDYQASSVNEGAADWLLRNGGMTEPWLFLIDRRGVIVDRWTPVFDVSQVADGLARVAG